MFFVVTELNLLWWTPLYRVYISKIGYSRWLVQALWLVVLALFGAVDYHLPLYVGLPFGVSFLNKLVGKFEIVEKVFVIIHVLIYVIFLGILDPRNEMILCV